MDHQDHVYLLRGGVSSPGGVWADLGSGTGAFTLALAELIGPTGQIYSVDKDGDALEEQERAVQARFQVTAYYVKADFTRPLSLPALDGVVMANALHFLPHAAKGAVIQAVKSCLRPGGRLILVEYNVDQGNRWVPYPLSYGSWEAMARRNGFVHTQLLATRPSRFLREIYSAVSW
jgi:SAM-dependent methyltransferase